MQTLSLHYLKHVPVQKAELAYKEGHNSTMALIKCLYMHVVKVVGQRRQIS